MPAINVDIKPAIIEWALNQVKDSQINTALKEKAAHWMDGTKTPTFNQIEDFSKKTNIPLGYFFLQSPPAENISLLEFRTIDSIELTDPSRNLIDTIYEMESIQDWMRDYRQDFGFEKLQFVGSALKNKNATSIAEAIRRDIGLMLNWYEQCSSANDAFNYLRRHLEACGVIIMLNGVVGKNTHRSLNIDEFRAFALIDEYAPLIFINSADTYGAKLFSLCHETAHIWIGKNDLYNNREYYTNGSNKLEVLCNAVAGELIVPNSEFDKKWKTINKNDIYAEIKTFAKFFNCSESVIARKALDSKKITQLIYDKIVENAINATKDYNATNKKSGGNYYNTVGSRLDKNLVKALCESIQSGRTSYTEAYRLTNTNRKTFSAVASQLGGVI